MLLGGISRGAICYLWRVIFRILLIALYVSLQAFEWCIYGLSFNYSFYFLYNVDAVNELDLVDCTHKLIFLTPLNLFQLICLNLSYIILYLYLGVTSGLVKGSFIISTFWKFLSDFINNDNNLYHEGSCFRWRN